MEIFRGNIILIVLLNSIIIYTQDLKENDSLSILNVLEDQKKAWNNNDIDKFMQGYLNSDKLIFVSKNGPLYGWDFVKNRYKTKYSSKYLMGNLDFEIYDLFLITNRSAILIGKFNLVREDEELTGFFSLIFKKIKGDWYIVSDHTS